MRATTCCFWLAIFVVLCDQSPAYPQSKYFYITDATNRMLELNSRGPGEDTLAAVEVARQACTALSLLIRDEQFLADLRRWADTQFSEERRNLKREMGLFINAFLLTEQEILRRAGFSEPSIQQMLWSAAMLRPSVDVSIEPNLLLSRIDQLRGDICEGASTLSQIQQREDVRRLFARWAMGVGGAGMIVADVAAATPSGGVAAASLALGGAAVGAALSPR